MQMQLNQQSRVEWLSEQIEINPCDLQAIEQRSLIYQAQGCVSEAISDCSKLIHLDVSRRHYVQRSKLFHSRGKYAEALKDLQIARKLEREGTEETAADIYLQNSVCMNSINQVEQMVHMIEGRDGKYDLQPYEKTLRQLLQVKQLKIKQLQEQRKAEVKQLKRYYEEQTKQLKQLLSNQLNEIKQKISNNYINYQRLLQKELANSDLKPIEITKLTLYFQNVASQMEKYYIAAKNLHKIQDKTIKFQDFQRILVDKNSNKYLTKLYKFFDKYSSQVQKIEDILQHIPYIGTTFKIIKKTMKANGWIQSINIQNECHNIQRIAVNITSFNQFSTNIAYYLVKCLQNQILNEEAIYKSKWELLVKAIKTIKQQHLGSKDYKHVISKQEQIVKDYAIIHASIIMIAYACNQLHFDKRTLQKMNKIYQKDKELALEEMSQICQVINKVEQILKNKIQEQNGNKQITNPPSSSCSIY